MMSSLLIVLTLIRNLDTYLASSIHDAVSISGKLLHKVDQLGHSDIAVIVCLQHMRIPERNSRSNLPR